MNEIVSTIQPEIDFEQIATIAGKAPNKIRN